jgi:hypothetical protein
MNQIWQFGSKPEEEINAEIEENVYNNKKKRHMSPFGSNSQGCIHLLKVIPGITSGRYYRYNFHEWEYSVQFFETMVTNV